MAIQIVDVDAIVQDEEFNTFLGGSVHSNPVHLAPDQWSQRSKPARQYALDRVLESLRRRSPPIQYSDLADPLELRLPILYGAAEHIYQLAITEPGDVWDTHRGFWADKFNEILNTLAPTVGDGETVSSYSFVIERR